MTVKNLIQQLNKCDPNAQVRVGTYCGTVDGIIKEISGEVLAPSNKQHCVYLECEMEYYNGEKVQHAYTVEEKRKLFSESNEAVFQ